MYRTQGGIFTTPGDAYTTPVDMWVKALGASSFHFLLVQRNQFLLPAFTLSFFGISISLTSHSDLLLEKLHRNHDLSRIRAIGGSAQVSSSLLSPILPIQLIHLSAARSRLVESKCSSQFSRTRPSPQPQQSTHVTMFLNTQRSGRSRYLGTYSRACHRSRSWWSRSHGSACWNLCPVVPNSGPAIACTRSLARCLGKDRSRSGRFCILMQHDVWIVGWNERTGSLRDWNVGARNDQQSGSLGRRCA